MYDSPSTITLTSFSPSTGKASVQDLRLTLFFKGLTQVRRIVDAYLAWRNPSIQRWTQEPWHPVWLMQPTSNSAWWTREITLDWAQLVDMGTANTMNLPPLR